MPAPGQHTDPVISTARSIPRRRNLDHLSRAAVELSHDYVQRYTV